MNKVLAILGIVLLILGIVIIPWAMLARAVEPVTDPYEVDRTTDSWNVSSKYLEGQRLVLKIGVGRNWAIFAEQTDEYNMTEGGLPVPVLVVPIVVLDPRGGRTEADLVYVARGGGSQLEQTLYIFLSNITHNDGGLTFEESYVQRNEAKIYLTPLKFPVDGVFLGITSYEGEYEVVIEESVPNPPSTLTLLKQQIRSVQPYLMITPIGAALVAAGTFSALMSRERKIPRGLRLRSNSGKK